MLARGWGRGGGKLLFNGYKVSHFQDEESSAMDRRDGSYILHSYNHGNVLNVPEPYAYERLRW